MMEGDEESTEVDAIDIASMQPYDDAAKETTIDEAPTAAKEQLTIDAEEQLTIDAEDGATEIENKLEQELDEIDIAEIACEGISSFEPMSLNDHSEEREVSKPL
jgi:hypothetical protein